jgi:hypothetical protein
MGAPASTYKQHVDVAGVGYDFDSSPSNTVESHNFLPLSAVFVRLRFSRGPALFARELKPPVRADATAAALSAAALKPPVRADATAATLLAPVLLPVVRADAFPFALFARVLDPPVGADATAPTLCARALTPPVRADAATLETLELLPPVLALLQHELAAATLSTAAPPLPVRADATAATLYTLYRDPAVRADAATAALLTPVLPPRVRAEFSICPRGRGDGARRDTGTIRSLGRYQR